MDAVKHAYEVLSLYDENAFLRDENARLREVERKYHELLNDSVRRGQEGVVGWLGLLMSDRVTIKA